MGIPKSPHVLISCGQRRTESPLRSFISLKLMHSRGKLFLDLLGILCLLAIAAMLLAMLRGR
jgi:hypothetical protein